MPVLLFAHTVLNADLIEAEASCPILKTSPFTSEAEIDSFLLTGEIKNEDETSIGYISEGLFRESFEEYFKDQMAVLFPTLELHSLSITRINESTMRLYLHIPAYQLLTYKRAIYPTDKANCTQLMLIDSSVYQADILYAAANSTTLPVLYTSSTLRSEIKGLKDRWCTPDCRLAIVADNSRMPGKPFLQYMNYFTPEDLELATTAYSRNMAFLCHEFKTIDFLACETLQNSSWQAYYDVLKGQGLTIGASDDATGNVKYGGDWLMESTGQDIQTLYFSDLIQNYQTTLVAPIKTLDGAEIFDYNLNQMTADNIEFQHTNAGEKAMVNLTGTWNGLGQIIVNGNNITFDGTAAMINNIRLFGVINTGCTGIIIQHIILNVETLALTESVGGICDGFGSSLSVAFNDCHVHSKGDIAISRISYGTGGTGGIAGSGSGFRSNSTQTFTGCSVNSNGSITIDGVANANHSAGSGGIAGGIVSLYNQSSSENNTQTFIGCSVNSNGSISIYGANVHYSGGGGGIAGGQGSYGYQNTFSFIGCSVNSYGTILITGAFNGAGGGGGGGIAGGIASYLNDRMQSTTLSFAGCSVNSNGAITISGVGGGANGGGGGGIAGGSGGSSYSNTLFLAGCSVNSNGTITILGTGITNGNFGGGPGGISGGFGNVSHENFLYFTGCSVNSNMTLTISGVDSRVIAGKFGIGMYTNTVTSTGGGINSLFAAQGTLPNISGLDYSDSFTKTNQKPACIRSYNIADNIVSVTFNKSVFIDTGTGTINGLTYKDGNGTTTLRFDGIPLRFTDAYGSCILCDSSASGTTPLLFLIKSTAGDAAVISFLNIPYSINFVGIQGSDILTIATASGKFIDKKVDLSKTVNITGLSLGGPDVANYTLSNTSGSTTATIAKATITAIASITGGGKTYDGTTTANIVVTGVTFTGKLYSDTLLLDTSNPLGAFRDKNAGAGKTINITGLSLSGTDRDNYFLASSSTATITPAPITAITGITAANKFYDNTTDATLNVTNAVLQGKLPNDNLLVNPLTAIGNFFTKDIGTAITVNITNITFSGTDAGNYDFTGTTASITADILTQKYSVKEAIKQFLLLDRSIEFTSDTPGIYGTIVFDKLIASANSSYTYAGVETLTLKDSIVLAKTNYYDAINSLPVGYSNSNSDLSATIATFPVTPNLPALVEIGETGTIGTMTINLSTDGVNETTSTSEESYEVEQGATITDALFKYKSSVKNSENVSQTETIYTWNIPLITNQAHPATLVSIRIAKLTEPGLTYTLIAKQMQQNFKLNVTNGMILKVGETFNLSTTGGSGTGVVTYSRSTENISLNGSLVTGINGNMGSAVVTATKNGDSTYMSASDTIFIDVVNA